MTRRSLARLITVACIAVAAAFSSSIVGTASARPGLPSLRYGSTGIGVQCVQAGVNRVFGPVLEVDGIFGPNTRHWVDQFQRSYGITRDGIVGPQTGTLIVDRDREVGWWVCWYYVPTYS